MALLLLAQWFLLLAFATSDRLHESVCDGAQQPSHNCAFVVLAKGHLSTSGEIAAAPAPAMIETGSVALPETSFRSIEDVRLAPDRGPPGPLPPT